MAEELTAKEIKKLILEKKVKPAEPVEPAAIVGVEGWLFRTSSYEMEGWREVCNAVKADGSPDEKRRRLGPAKLIQISFRDKSGEPVFAELDLPIIGGLPDSEVNRVFKRCLAINGYGGEGIEAILKNLIAITGIDGVYASLANIGAQCPNCGEGTLSMSFESNGFANNTGLPAEQPISITQSSPEK